MQRVQGVALKLIAEAGYAAVSIERIANVADVGVATIFRHFGTKDRIVLWDEADEDSAEALFGAISEIGVRSAVLMFAARLDDAGVAVTHTDYDGMIHGFYWMDAVLDDAVRLQRELAAWLRSVL